MIIWDSCWSAAKRGFDCCAGTTRNNLLYYLIHLFISQKWWIKGYSEYYVMKVIPLQLKFEGGYRGSLYCNGNLVLMINVKCRCLWHNVCLARFSVCSVSDSGYMCLSWGYVITFIDSYTYLFFIKLYNCPWHYMIQCREVSHSFLYRSNDCIFTVFCLWKI